LEGILINILAFAAVLGPMVVIHEFGHFIVAKLFGIRVEVFSVGFGKRLWGFRRGDTDYRLSLFPLGGYVKMSGENIDDQATGAPYEFRSKPKWQRFCVAVAGPAMNILAAFAIPAVHSMIHHEVLAYQTKPPIVNAVESNSSAHAAGILPGDRILMVENRPTPTWRDVEEQIIINPEQGIPVTIERNGETKTFMMNVAVRTVDSEKLGDAGLEPNLGPDTRLTVREVAPGSPAEAAGLKTGDQIVAINGNRIVQGLVGQQEVIRTIQNSKGQPVTLTVVRNGETVDIVASAREDGGTYKIGFGPALIGVERLVTRLSLGQAVAYSYDTNMRIIRLTGKAIGQLFEGKRRVGDTVSGPVGIFRFTGQAAQQGFGTILDWMAMISLSLGVFNLFPIPMLDGGLILTLCIEAVLGWFGLPLRVAVEERIRHVGLVLLMLLLVFVTFNDISKYFPKSSEPQKVEQQKTEPDR
jgi:regulator of sigma E protease